MTDNQHLMPAVFLDRDGTLVEEVNYLSKVEDLELFPFTAPALEKLKAAGYLLVVVTNQSGIGRGIYTEDDMHSIHREIQSRLGGLIDGFYFCPHLPCDGCECRKPGQKLIQDAVAALNVDLSRSWMIGDKNIDIETGINAGMRTCLVATGYGRSHKETHEVEATVFAADLGEAADRILESGDGA